MAANTINSVPNIGMIMCADCFKTNKSGYGKINLTETHTGVRPLVLGDCSLLLYFIRILVKDI